MWHWRGKVATAAAQSSSHETITCIHETAGAFESTSSWRKKIGVPLVARIRGLHNTRGAIPEGEAQVQEEEAGALTLYQVNRTLRCRLGQKVCYRPLTGVVALIEVSSKYLASTRPSWLYFVWERVLSLNPCKLYARPRQGSRLEFLHPTASG